MPKCDECRRLDALVQFSIRDVRSVIHKLNRNDTPRMRRQLAARKKEMEKNKASRDSHYANCEEYNAKGP